MGTKVAFLDTMIFLHFRQIDEVDWCRELDCEGVELVIAPVVYRQLDRHKDKHPVAALRERAKTAVSKLRSLLRHGSSANVRDDVTLTFEHADPVIDFAAHRLVKDVEDDQLIASMLQRAHGRPGEEIILVSDDLLLEHKARASGFTAVIPGEANRLPDTPTEEQKRLKQLEAENRRLSHRRPDLKVTFATGEQRYEVVLTPMPSWTAAYKEERMRKIRAAHPPLPIPGPVQYPTITVDGDEVGPESQVLLESPLAEVRRKYNEDALQDYYRAYGEYLDRQEVYEIIQSRSIRMDLVLTNDGTAVARDIDIMLEIPGAVKVFEGSDELLECPEEPEEPEEPSFTARAPFLGSFGSLDMEAVGPAMNIPSIYEPSIDVVENSAKGAKVEISLRKLKHRKSEPLPSFLLLFTNEEAIAPVQLTYTINSEDLLENQVGTLHLVVRRRV